MSQAEVSVWVKVPPGTKVSELQVEITPTRLMIKLHWYGRVVDGPLFRRCKAREAVWVLQDDEVAVMIPKDDGYFWKVRGDEMSGEAAGGSWSCVASVQHVQSRLKSRHSWF
jgi:hypothetical protein